MNEVSSILGGIAPVDFLKEYWQKKPLLIRNALPGFEPPVTPDELAGLACEEEVTSRLIIEKGGAYPWQLLEGPFDEAQFSTLPETHWTLLVQEVDRLVPEVKVLLEYFRFIPNWRIDDIMISYAPKDGGVGAHIDNYDVFLLQGMGHRRWQISSNPVKEERLVPDLDVRILEDFEPDQDWVLGPGDMLYLPPRIPHYGVALDECMTLSVGFRAPSYAELLHGFVIDAMQRLDDPEGRYSDPDLKPQMNAGEISPSALKKIRSILESLLRDEREIDRWFGRFITEPRRFDYGIPLDTPCTSDQIAELLRDGAPLERATFARFAYIQFPKGDTSLFVNGVEFHLQSEIAGFASVLSGGEPLLPDVLQAYLPKPGFTELVTELINRGFLLAGETFDEE